MSLSLAADQDFGRMVATTLWNVPAKCAADPHCLGWRKQVGVQQKWLGYCPRDNGGAAT